MRNLELKSRQAINAGSNSGPMHDAGCGLQFLSSEHQTEAKAGRNLEGIRHGQVVSRFGG
jgi:hypothetical protein